MDVLVNAAMSVDGKLSSRERAPVRISGRADMVRVHRLRADADAIMVGIGTVLADDPRLLVDRSALDDDGREPDHPLRVIVDSNARTPPDARVIGGDAGTLVVATDAAPSDRIDALEAAGATVEHAGEDRVDLDAAIDLLDARGVRSLLVEGGGELVFSLFQRSLVDELSVYVGSILIGGRDAPTLADGTGFVHDYPSLDLVDVERLDDGVLLTYTT